MEQLIDYYTILKVGRNATVNEIKAAYKKRCMEWHPDRNPYAPTQKSITYVARERQRQLKSGYKFLYELQKGKSSYSASFSTILPRLSMYL
jgi:curved DNA-binding protein CbpA